MLTTQDELQRLRTKGFKKLKDGHIHLRCPTCGRKMSNAIRADYDHPKAILMESQCPKCNQDYDDIHYFDKGCKYISMAALAKITHKEG